MSQGSDKAPDYSSAPQEPPNYTEDADKDTPQADSFKEDYSNAKEHAEAGSIEEEPADTEDWTR